MSAGQRKATCAVEHTHGFVGEDGSGQSNVPLQYSSEALLDVEQCIAVIWKKLRFIKTFCLLVGFPKWRVLVTSVVPSLRGKLINQ